MCCILGRMKNRNEESAIVRVYVHLYSDTERGWGYVPASLYVCRVFSVVGATNSRQIGELSGKWDTVLGRSPTERAIPK